MQHTWVEISKSALLHNISEHKLLIGPQTKLIAVVKANAYGHGIVKVARIIESEVDYLAVVNLEEAKKLRKAEVKPPIIVLSYTPETAEDILWAINERVEIAINSLTHAKLLSKIIDNSPAGAEDLKIHIKVDTGMARLGILWENAVEYIKKINELPHLKIKGIFSHFADVVGHMEYSKEQLKRFEDIKFQLFREKIQFPMFHIAKTEAILDFGESQYDAVRLGIGLYGLWPDKKLIDRVRAAHPEFKLKPALTWKAKILQVKNYPKGEYVGYGCAHKTKKQTKIAILPIGYYEGYDRELSNKGKVLIYGKRCPIIGRVCMNLSMVDVTDALKVEREDEVVLLGAQGTEEITADEMADWLNTINYEVVTRINPKIERRIVE